MQCEKRECGVRRKGAVREEGEVWGGRAACEEDGRCVRGERCVRRVGAV